ncbi:hypothetical protein QUF72_01595 [Desulfobacterales bacterium HSG2]|nr:hypothetical protein [Desulfobacterales bacterium HSG2]
MTSKKHCYCIELLVSAGPRKGNYTARSSAHELGEDAGGILSLPDISFFWLSDGTSHEPVLYEFSSRIFAQDLGLCYRRAAFEEYEKNADSLSLENILENMLKRVKTLWKERLKEKWGQFRDNEREQFLEKLTLCGDNSRRSSWSSTISGGFILSETMEIHYFNAGDSGGLFTTSADDRVTLIKPNKKRIFIAIDWLHGDEMPKCTLIRRNIKDEIGKGEQISNFAFLTDGNANDLEKFLDNMQGKNFRGISHILRRLRQVSYDDKAVLFGSLIQLEDDFQI